MGREALADLQLEASQTMLLRTTLRARLSPSRSLPRPVLAPSRLSSSVPLIHIQDATFYRQYPTEENAATNPPLFPNLNFKLPATETSAGEKQFWAILGPSGRTDLLDILRGQHISIPPTARSYPYLLSDEIAAKDSGLRIVSNAIQYIGFSGEGSGAIGGTRGAYLSARYESHREETDWTVEQFLRGQTSLNPMEGEEKGTLRDEGLLQEVIADLRLGSLLDMPVANLSNGQTRRARIAKALLKKPELLLLDEPFMGLDPATVRSISELLFRLAQKNAPRLILALRPQNPMPDWITHISLIGNSHQILKQGSRAIIDRALTVWRKEAKKLDDDTQKVDADVKKLLRSGALDQQLLRDFTSNQPSLENNQHHTASLGGEPVIEMDGVRVQYGDKVVLGDWRQQVDKDIKDGLHWRVRRGQRWAILGANGSGKTTLLSLITSDHPQTYALPVKLFGRSRLAEPGLPAISIFELQSRLGHSSPEIHAFFPRQLTVRAALESAFAETFLARPRLEHQHDLDISAMLRAFKADLDPNATTAQQSPPAVSTDSKFFPKLPTRSSTPYIPNDYDVEYADQIRFGQLTTAQQRIVLFLRALIHKPDIVILDEPFSGLTASQRDKCLKFLEFGDCTQDAEHRRHYGLSEDQALIMISHVKEEIPDMVRNFMRLPSEPSDASEPLDFRVGLLKPTSKLRDPKIWETAWSSPTQFDQVAEPTGRRESEQAVSDPQTYAYISV
ncbi:hypothetical protein N7532_000861 [Penicillium argentinense]|uniref:ABC transporter domain-containing protein n=1 Tax=Penicillium argentinense TaxID=1131581 RepID=A0A9W9KP90_9EURO|nr:uncharacterized protein N7532_000861 [Penicillium argentinense]KAJ5112816.1 hypothetical protein N7532_000861 [Penicillium argentinense]